MLRDDVNEVTALWDLRLLSTQEVIDWAVAAVGSGIDLAAVVALASLDPDSTDQVDPLLDNVRADLGLPPLSERDAGLAAAASFAARLGEGLATAIETARAIWRIANLAPASEPELRAFIGLASEWEDDPEHREIYEEEIRSEALRLSTARDGL